MLKNTLRGAALLAIVATASACSNTAENPLAPETSSLSPGSAALSIKLLPPGGVRPPGQGEIETLGYTLGWP